MVMVLNFVFPILFVFPMQYLVRRIEQKQQLDDAAAVLMDCDVQSF